MIDKLVQITIYFSRTGVWLFVWLFNFTVNHVQLLPGWIFKVTECTLVDASITSEWKTLANYFELVSLIIFAWSHGHWITYWFWCFCFNDKLSIQLSIDWQFCNCWRHESGSEVKKEPTSQVSRLETHLSTKKKYKNTDSGKLRGRRTGTWRRRRRQLMSTC